MGGRTAGGSRRYLNLRTSCLSHRESLSTYIEFLSTEVHASLISNKIQKYFFKRQREKANVASPKGKIDFYNMMIQIADEIQGCCDTLTCENIRTTLRVYDLLICVWLHEDIGCP